MISFNFIAPVAGVLLGAAILGERTTVTVRNQIKLIIV